MEKAPGVQLHKVWGEMHEYSRLKLIQHLTLLEKELSWIHFPAFDNLYFRQSIPREHSVLLDPNIDPSGAYCVVLAADILWLNDKVGDGFSKDNGPCTSKQIRFTGTPLTVILFRDLPPRIRRSSCSSKFPKNVRHRASETH